MIQRTFIPGSEWLYFKLYTGLKTADELLTQALWPHIQELSDRKLIDGWFFIRYSDPDFHLRFRLHVGDPAGYSEIFRLFLHRLEPHVERGSVSKIMCDTYVREIERYGERTMESAERLFSTDSDAVLQLLAALSDLPLHDREAIRWQLALLLLDDTLTAFGLEVEKKGKLLALSAENFRKEFGFTTSSFTKQLNDKYRILRKEIDQTLSSRERSAPCEPILQARKERIGALAAGIEAAERDHLLPSLMHMTMNRWFRANNRQHELVVYDFLNRHYESVQARAKAKNKA